MNVVRRAVLFAALVSPVGICQSAAGAEMFRLAGGQGEEAAYTASVAIASLIKFELLPTMKIDLETVNSNGAVDNIRQLQQGLAAFAIVPSVVGHAARASLGPFAGEVPDLSLRAITTLWQDAVHLVIREEDVTTGTVDDLELLPGRKVLLSETASGLAHANQLLLGKLGLDVEDKFEIAHVPDGDGLAAIKRGDIDAFSTSAKPPMVVVENVFKTTSPSLKLLDITAQQLAKINGTHWLWTPYVIPASTYPGQDADINTIALSNHLVVSADVDDDVVYAVTKSIFENLDYIHRVDPLMADLNLENALAGMSMPLHPGALRYFMEVGLVAKAPSLILPADRELPNERLDEISYPDSDVASEGRSNPKDQATGVSALDGIVSVDTSEDDVEPEFETLPEHPLDPEGNAWRQRATL
ncbi:MAG: TAXI family TRAP transporter solute-binding subunit [Geminicoccaceae bacterium]